MIAIESFLDILFVWVYPLFTFDFEFGFQIPLKSLKHVYLVPAIHWLEQGIHVLLISTRFENQIKKP